MTAPENRDISGRFSPGVSGNPGGRPQGLAKYIRDQTANGEELVDFMLSILRGEVTEDIRLQAQAATWLSDRAFGRPRTEPSNLGSTWDEDQILVDGQDPVVLLKEKIEAIRARMIAHASSD